jgi:hypothetical protein
MNQNKIMIQQLTLRERIRKALVIFAFLTFPIMMKYFSPNVIVEGAMNGIINGSLDVKPWSKSSRWKIPSASCAEPVWTIVPNQRSSIHLVLENEIICVIKKCFTFFDHEHYS